MRMYACAPHFLQPGLAVFFIHTLISLPLCLPVSLSIFPSLNTAAGPAAGPVAAAGARPRVFCLAGLPEGLCTAGLPGHRGQAGADTTHDAAAGTAGG